VENLASHVSRLVTAHQEVFSIYGVLRREWGVDWESCKLSQENCFHLLDSPASGEYFFHASFSIGWPKKKPRQKAGLHFQFIGFPSEWGEAHLPPWQDAPRRFQFIGFPSEWGVLTMQLKSQYVWGSREIIVEVTAEPEVVVELTAVVVGTAVFFGNKVGVVTVRYSVRVVSAGIDAFRVRNVVSGGNLVN